MTDKGQLRKQMQDLRKQVSPETQAKASEQAAIRFLESDIYRSAQHLGVYRASDGELDPLFVIESAWRDQKQLYLPVVDFKNKGPLMFVSYTPKTTLITNRFGILEPQISNHAFTNLSVLDCVLVPLVAVDRQGHRIGRGGGHYDRTFKVGAGEHKPTQVGLAYTWQVIETIAPDAWDLTLDAVITENTCFQH